jgi:hypothetical protein
MVRKKRPPDLDLPVAEPTSVAYRYDPRVHGTTISGEQEERSLKGIVLGIALVLVLAASATGTVWWVYSSADDVDVGATLACEQFRGIASGEAIPPGEPVRTLLRDMYDDALASREAVIVTSAWNLLAAATVGSPDDLAIATMEMDRACLEVGQ